MDVERQTVIRVDSASSPDEAAAAFSPVQPSVSAPSRSHDDRDVPTLTLNTSLGSLARENERLREELAQHRLSAARFRRLFDLPLVGSSITSP